MDLTDLIKRWLNEELSFKETETLVNLLIIDNERLESERLYENIKVPIDVISELKTICGAAEMQHAGFGFPHEEIVTTPHLGTEIRQHPTEYIKETTRLYRQSWIIEPLKRLIKDLGGAEV